MVSAGASVSSAAALGTPLAQFDSRFLLLAAATLLISSRVAVKIPRTGGRITVSDTGIFLTMLLCGGEEAVLLAAADGAFSTLRISRKPLTILFNAGVMACSTFLTVGLLRLCFGDDTVGAAGGQYSAPMAAVCLMACVQYAANSWLVAIDATLRVGGSFWRMWKEFYLWTSVTYFAGAWAAHLAARLVSEYGFHSVIAATPIVAIVYFTYQTYLKSLEATGAQAAQAERHVGELSRHIAEQERISLALQESEQRFRSAFNHAAGTALVSPEGRWLQVNHSLCQMLGFTEQELLATDFQAVTHPDDLAEDLASTRRLLEECDATRPAEKRYLHRDGREVWVLQSASVVRDQGGAPLHLIFQIQDITDRKRNEELVRFAAYHDALTGLPNRALLTDRLTHAIARARRSADYQHAVLFLDLDRFKVVNDSLGHTLGDALLVQLSRRLEACVRDDDSVARLGSDEFAILLDGIRDSGVPIRVAERIKAALALPFDLDGHEIYTTASIGIAYSTAEYLSSDDMLRDADTAMYRAKSAGKARHEIFDTLMHSSAVELLRLENDLRRALDRGELRVFYQPIVTLATGSVVGFEALARWQHPERGLIPPADFIPLAEETGLIVPLGLHVLREACRQTRAWQDEFPSARSLNVSVNLSARQLSQPDLILCVRQALEDSGLAPYCLKLEITETVLMENAGSAIEMLMQLRRLGVQLSVDDFGTGYSSLSYLHRLPIDTLKIDRSFVSRMDEDGESTGIVEIIMMLASKLNKLAVAEGVETQEQARRLTALGCELGQGYFFSPPVCAESAAGLLRGAGPCRPGAAGLAEGVQEALSSVN